MMLYNGRRKIRGKGKMMMERSIIEESKDDRMKEKKRKNER